MKLRLQSVREVVSGFLTAMGIATFLLPLQRMPQSNHLHHVSSDHPPRRSWPFLQVNNPNYESTLRCEVASDFSELEEVSSDWERLWQADCRAEIFQTLEWTRAWWQSYGHDLTLCSPIVFEGNKVIGILPLVKRGNAVQFLGAPEADYADLLCEEGREKAVVAAALRALFQSDSSTGTSASSSTLRKMAASCAIVRVAPPLAQACETGALWSLSDDPSPGEIARRSSSRC